MKKIKNYNYLQIRKINYKDRIKSSKKFDPPIDINNWMTNPYTWFKSIFYIEISSIIVFVSHHLKISPNFLTGIYILLGLVGGLFLSINNNSIIVIGLIIFFSRGSFDWSDGVLARLTGQTSNLGNLLDNWGAKVGSISFTIGFGFYLHNIHNEFLIVYLILFIKFLKLIDLRDYSYHLATFELIKIKNKKKYLEKINLKRSKLFRKKGFNFYIFFKNIFLNFVDERSRTIDLILGLIYLDIFYFNIYILKYIFYYMAFKTLIVFLAGIYAVIFKNYVFRENNKILNK